MKKVLFALFLPLFLVASTTSPVRAAEQCAYGDGTYADHGDTETDYDGTTYRCNDGEWVPED